MNDVTISILIVGAVILIALVVVYFGLPTVSNNGSQLRIGKGILKVAAECGVGSGTVRCIKREMEEGRQSDDNVTNWKHQHPASNSGGISPRRCSLASRDEQ